MLSEGYMNHLHSIGIAKTSLPLSLREWCNKLGLYVQVNDSRGATTVKAGGKFIAKVHLRAEYASRPYPTWEVKKYEPGDWEALIEPTLQLSGWICQQYYKGAMEIPSTVNQLKSAIEVFRRTGRLGPLDE